MQSFEDILFILGYAYHLSKEKYVRNGFFILPLSKENIIRNLVRIDREITWKGAKKQLMGFLETYKGDIEVKGYGHDFTYYTYSKPNYRHSYVKNKCYPYDRGFYDTETGISLKGELVKEAEKIFSNYRPDCEAIYQELIGKIRTVKDLIFLTITEQISERNYNGKQASGIKDSLDLKQFDLDKKPLKEMMNPFPNRENDGSFKFSEFNRDIEVYFRKYMPSDQRAFLLLNAHSFNTSSCYLVKYLYFHPRLSEFIYTRLSPLSLKTSIKESYSSKLLEFEKRYGSPVFESKDRTFQLLKQIDSRLGRGERMFTFMIDGYETELKALCDKGMLRIEDEDIKIKDKEKFFSFYQSVREKEHARINFITESFIKEWQSIKLNIRDDKVVFAGQIKRPVSKPETKIPAAAPQSGAKMEEIAAPLPDRLKVFLGHAEDQGKVFWEPGTLFNGHFIIVGSSGVGKTETIRCIASELSNQGSPVLMIDFHGDMACKNGDIKTYRVSEKSEYYFNPLELNPQFKEITPLKAAIDFRDAVLINFSSMGLQQKDRLKEIIKGAYDELGISNDKTTWSREVPFDYIVDRIKGSKDKETQTLRGYLGDISDFGLFSGSQKISMRDILYGKITHINLRPLPESLRSLYADLLLRKLYYSLQALEEIPVGNIKDKDKFRVFVIIDEAKLLVKENQGVKAVLNKYATEIRKYGGALILASQLITHFNEEILNNVATKLCMKVEDKKEAQQNSKFFGVNEETLLNLKQGEGILGISHQDKKEEMRIKIVPTWERIL